MFFVSDFLFSTNHNFIFYKQLILSNFCELFNKPTGRTPLGMFWNSSSGIFLKANKIFRIHQFLEYLSILDISDASCLIFERNSC